MLYGELVQLCITVRRASTPFTSMSAIWALRQFLVENTGALHVSLELALHDRESLLDEDQKEIMRVAGYLFPEDLDNSKEWANE